MESVQYNAALAITGAIRGTSREKVYQELGLESLHKRRWYRKLCCIFKIFKGQSPEYLFKIFLSVSKAYNTRANNNIPHFSAKHIFLKKSSFPSTVIEWNNLGLKIRNSETSSAVQKSVLELIRPIIFNYHSPNGIKLITRLRLSFSHLRERKLRHNI